MQIKNQAKYIEHKNAPLYYETLDFNIWVTIFGNTFYEACLYNAF